MHTQTIATRLSRTRRWLMVALTAGLLLAAAVIFMLAGAPAEPAALPRALPDATTVDELAELRLARAEAMGPAALPRALPRRHSCCYRCRYWRCRKSIYSLPRM